MKIQSTNINFGTKYKLIPANTLKDMLAKRYTYKQIAEICNVPVHVVNRSIKYSTKKDEQRVMMYKDEIIRLFKNGFSISDISSYYSINRNDISKIILRDITAKRGHKNNNIEFSICSQADVEYVNSVKALAARLDINLEELKDQLGIS